MKNKLKMMILFIIIIMTSGCSVEYNLIINEDYSVSEKVIALENTKKMESLTRLKGDSAITYLYNTFKRDGEKINLSSNVESKNTKVTATTSHSSIEEYMSKFKSDVFKKVIVQKNNGVVTFTADQTEKLSSDEDYSLIYDDITVNIYVPFKVIEHNADSVNGNTYSWTIKKDNNLKNIKILYDEGSKKNNVNIKINNKTYNINYVIIVISGIIVLLLVITLIVYIKNKKNNIV